MTALARLTPKQQELLEMYHEGLEIDTIRHGVYRVNNALLSRGLIQYLPIEGQWELTDAGKAMFEERDLTGNIVDMFAPKQKVEILTWNNWGGKYRAIWDAGRVVKTSSSRVLVAIDGKGYWRDPRMMRPAPVVEGV